MFGTCCELLTRSEPLGVRPRRLRSAAASIALSASISSAESSRSHASRGCCARSLGQTIRLQQRREGGTAIAGCLFARSVAATYRIAETVLRKCTAMDALLGRR